MFQLNARKSKHQIPENKYWRNDAEWVLDRIGALEITTVDNSHHILFNFLFVKSEPKKANFKDFGIEGCPYGHLVV